MLVADLQKYTVLAALELAAQCSITPEGRPNELLFYCVHQG